MNKHWNWALNIGLLASVVAMLLPVKLLPKETSADDPVARHGHEIRLINQYLERFHYREFALDDRFSVELIYNYLDKLDPGKLFFAQADIDEFSKIEEYFDDYIRSGDTQAATQIFAIYKERVKQRTSYALQRLEQDFDFELTESYQIDRKDAPWAQDTTALDDLWRKRIKSDLIDLTLAGDTQEAAKVKLKKRYANIQRRTKQIKTNEIFQLYANAYTSSIEPHTSYFSPRATEEFNIHMRLSLQGIGAVLKLEDETTEVIRIVPGGPADQSGQIHPKDKILGVAQGEEGVYEDIIGWRLSDVVDKIRGKKGSKVKLSIQSAEMGANVAPKDVVIIRDNIELESQAAKKNIIEVTTQTGTSKLGVITLPLFYIDFEARTAGEKNYRSTTRDVANLLEEMQQDGVEGLVIDLRGNGGGSLEEVVSLTGLFIDHGPVVQVRNKNGKITTRRDRQKGALYTGPLAVMVDKRSASASEIFAGAIQDYDRGLIIGEPTFGKGTVQNVLPLGLYANAKYKDKLGQMKITIAQFFRINGDSTQHRGVIPDIGWPLPYSQQEFGESAYDNALPWASIRKLNYIKTANFDDLTLGEVQDLHRERIKNDVEFLATIKKLEVFMHARKETHLSLNLATRSSKREQFNQTLLAAENMLRLADGLEAYETYEELREAARNEADNPAPDEEFSADVFLAEAGKILNDFRHLISAHTARTQPDAIVPPAIAIKS